MKYVLTGIWIILSFAVAAELAAEKVYTWTDENGKLHITQDPPPQKAKLKDTIEYEPQPARLDLESERRPGTGAEAESIKPKSDEIQKARVEAEIAKEAAEIAKDKAEEATRMAKEYSQSNDPSPIMQQTYDFQMELAIEAAKAAEERARIAEEKAIKAEKTAGLDEERAKPDED